MAPPILPRGDALADTPRPAGSRTFTDLDVRPSAWPSNSCVVQSRPKLRNHGGCVRRRPENPARPASSVLVAAKADGHEVLDGRSARAVDELLRHSPRSGLMMPSRQPVATETSAASRRGSSVLRDGPGVAVGQADPNALQGTPSRVVVLDDGLRMFMTRTVAGGLNIG